MATKERSTGCIQIRVSLGQIWTLASVAAPLTVLFVAAVAKTTGSSVNRIGPQRLANPAYRLQVYASDAHPELAATKDWTLEYRFTVPPLPISPTWNHKIATVYQWGDVDFDEYGTRGKYKLSDYQFNQITPQLILGSTLDANDAHYKPSWSQRSAWAIEAHYFWQNGTTFAPYAQTGKVIVVNPGDHLTTIIRFDAKAGTIVASIEDGNIPGSAGLSTITIQRPFPNEPSLFKSWTDFFQKATAASRSPYVNGTTQLDVETDYLDQQTMCGLLPFTITKIVMPGVPSIPSAFTTAQLGGFTCEGPLTNLDF
jgi:hypothetical protein